MKEIKKFDFKHPDIKMYRNIHEGGKAVAYVVNEDCKVIVNSMQTDFIEAGDYIAYTVDTLKGIRKQVFESYFKEIDD